MLSIGIRLLPVFLLTNNTHKENTTMKPMMITNMKTQTMMQTIMTMTAQSVSQPYFQERLLQNQELHHAVSESVR